MSNVFLFGVGLWTLDFELSTGQSASTGNSPRQASSSPGEIKVTPSNNLAACIAASGFEATATLILHPSPLASLDLVARFAISFASS